MIVVTHSDDPNPRKPPIWFLRVNIWSVCGATVRIGLKMQSIVSPRNIEIFCFAQAQSDSSYGIN